MYVYALAQGWAPPPAPMIWKKGEEGKEREEAGGGAGGYAGDRACGARRRGSLQPLLGGALTPAAPVGPRPRHSQRLPAADR